VAQGAERHEVVAVTERDLYGLPPADETDPDSPAETLPARPTGAADGTPERLGDDLPSWLRPPVSDQEPVRLPDGYDGGEEPPFPDQPSVGQGPILAGALAGLLAALIGAAAWGLVAQWTDREVGVVAWGIGLLVAGSIRFVAGRGGHDLQLVAVVEVLGALLVGKYLAFAFLLEDEFGTSTGVLSTDTLDLFRSSLRDLFSTYDLLWIALAFVSSWVILVPADAPGARDTEHEYHTRNPVDRFTRRLPRDLRIAVDWFVTIVGAVAIVLLVKAYVVNPYRIPSSSMEPSLHCARPGNDCEARFSDRVLANRFVYHLRDPKRGEIAVFETPPNACGVGGTFVKRVIGLPGEKLELRLIRGDGYVFINGKRLEEPYVRSDRRQLHAAFGPITVPKDHYFMLGDNREQSCDSREWGALPRDNLIGKVFATYWPPQRLSLH
jgi:signal peptidase I